MGRIVAITLLTVALSFVSYQAWGVIKDQRGLEVKAEEIAKSAEGLGKENQMIKEQIDRLGKSDNLVKELKARFNYRLPEEKVIIVTEGNNKSE